MASAVEQIIVEVAMDTRDFDRNIKRTKGKMRGFGKQMSKTTGKGSAGFGGMLTKANIALAVTVGLLVKATGAIMEAGDAFDLLHQKLIASTGSSANARKAWGESSRIAEKLGLDVRGVAQGLSQFTLAGGDSFGKDTVKVFEQLSTGIAGLGATTDETKGIFLAFAQILSKGKLSMEEVNQLAERGIGRNLIAEALGVDSIEGLDIKAPDAIEKIASFMEKRFKGASEKGAKSIQAMSNRMANNMFELKVEFNEAIKPFRALFLSLSSTILSSIKAFMPEIMAFVGILKKGIAFWMSNILPIGLAWGQMIWALIGAVKDLIMIGLQPLLDMLAEVFDISSIEDFTADATKFLFKMTAVFSNFTDSVKLGFLSAKEAMLNFLGKEIPTELADEIDKLDKKLAKAFKKSDDKAKKLIKTLRDGADALLNFKEIDVKGEGAGKGDVKKVESPAFGGKGAGAVEFGSTEAFKIIGTKIDKTDKENLNANKRTAKAVEKISKDTKKTKVLDV